MAALHGPPSSTAKPKLRGVSHKYAFFAFTSAALTLSAIATSNRLAVLLYGASLAFLFGVSALYHRLDWAPAARRRMRSLDHSAIFVLIAGSYTPLFWLLTPTDPTGVHPLVIVWCGAAVGVTKSLAWPDGPKWLTALLAVAVGWAVVAEVAALAAAMGTMSLALLVTSGVVYSLGAIVYAVRRPDPRPTIFGYHEVFHSMVILGGVLHFAHVVLVLQRAGSLS